MNNGRKLSLDSYDKVPTVDFLEIRDKNEDESDTEDDEECEKDTQCGISTFRPAWIQRFATPRFFFANYCLLGVLQGGFFTYLVGCLSTLERRYQYESKTTGLIMIADEISPILFGLLVGYFGGKSHRPRLVAAGMYACVLSCFITVLPYFIYGPIRHTAQMTSVGLTNKTSKVEFCDMSENSEVCEFSPTVPAVSLLFLGNFMKGIAGLAFYTIGTSYLDDSVKKKDSAMYFGILYAVRLLGPTIGFLLSSFCLDYYEDPLHDPGFNQKDPRWVGAWWMGFVILGIAISLVSLPTILFPRRFAKKKLPASLKNTKTEGQKEKMSPMQQFKDMKKATGRLIKNPIFMCHMIGGVLRVNGIMGLYVYLPKYMEAQFRQSASKANLYSGPASIVSMQLGTLVGGYVIRRVKPRPRFLTGYIVFVEFFSIIGLLICMMLTCPSVELTGTTLNGNRLQLENSCNVDCSCSTRVFTPICGPDGKSTYFSPCYAGCESGFKENGTQFYQDCKCVHDELGEFSEGVAEKSYCGVDCQLMVVYVVVLSIGKMISSTARVGNTLVTLRCVDPQDKSIALGGLQGLFSLLAFVPYPLIYGALTDQACLVWEKSCGKTGNCWIYDADKFRYYLHGVSSAFILLGSITDVIVCILSTRLKKLYDDDEDGVESNAEDVKKPSETKENFKTTEKVENSNANSNSDVDRNL